MRDTFIFYRSFYEAIKELPAQNKVELIEAICEFSLNFEEPELIGLSKTIWTLIRPNLEANRKRFENGSKPKLKQNISETEAKRKQKESKREANKDKDKDKDKDNNVDKDNKIDNKLSINSVNEKNDFISPSLSECYWFLKNKYANRFPTNWHIEQAAEMFWNFYTERNWMVKQGNRMVKMKSWERALQGCLTWSSFLNILKLEKPLNWVNQFEQKKQIEEIQAETKDETPPQSNIEAYTIHDKLAETINILSKK